MTDIFFFSRLGIKNFRSIDTDGIQLEGLNKINLLIGKNNCGKSNVLKLLKILQKLKGGFRSYPNNIENQHNRNFKPASLFFTYTLQELGFPSLITFNDSNNILYNIDIKECLANPITIEYNFSEENFKIHQCFTEKYSYNKESIIRQILVHINASERDATGWQAIEKHYELQMVKHFTKALSQVIYIPDFRFINEGGGFQQSTSLINGSNIISEVNKMKNPKIGEEENRKKFLFIEETIGKMLGENNLSVDISHDVKEMILTINNTRLPLENFGTGIQELILMCSALIIHDEHLICIEEPEIHLHPELQKKFFSFLLETNNQYFITTHSNSFLDFANKNVSIYHFTHDGISTKVNRCLNDKSSKQLIEDLGYTNSDILQSNGIIWVEGPSDRTFINKWVSLKSSEYKEGIHYTIMFYGGRLLSHLTCLYDFINDELIQLLKINSNAYIVLDRDDLSRKINETKQRITEEIGEGRFWITEGREIENYLSLKTTNNWLNAKQKNQLQKSIEKGKKFDKEITSLNLSFDYSSNKNQFSKELVNYIDEEDLNILDLNKKIDELLAIVSSWNK